MAQETNRLIGIPKEDSFAPNETRTDQKEPQANPTKVEPAIFETKIEKTEVPAKFGKKASACVHTHRAIYAKNMCNYCYHKIGRTKLATECPHLDRPLYCHKKCMTCYNMEKWSRSRP